MMNVSCFERGEENGTVQLNRQNVDISSCSFTFMLPSDNVVNVLISVSVLLMVLALVVNVFTIFGLDSSEDISWQHRYTLLKNLIICDLLQLANCGPAIIHSLAQRRTMSFNMWCWVQYFMGGTCIFVSLLTITFMAVERYVYVCHAIRYLVILTNERLYFAISLTWVVSLFINVTNMILLHLHGQRIPGHPTLGLLCEPDTVEQHMSFPQQPAIFRKVTGNFLLLFCLLCYSFSYLGMYQAARNAVAPFNLVNMRARKTVLFYCGMLLLQLLPLLTKVVSDSLWELEGTGAMTAPLETVHVAGLSLWASILHMSLLMLVMVPPCINPLVFGLRNLEVREALRKLLWWKRYERRPYPYPDIMVITQPWERETAALEISANDIPNQCQTEV